MRTLSTVVILGLTLSGCARTKPQTAPAGPPVATEACPPGASSMVRTTLFFGQSRPDGTTLTADDWQGFLEHEVTARFPDGLTVWEAAGQWRMKDGSLAREQSKVLMLIHDRGEKVREQVQEIVENYKKQFQQESVLVETTNICAAF